MKRCLFSILILVFAACEKQEILSDVEDLAGFREVSHEMMVLGEKLEDPYSLDNVQLAVKSLYPKSDRTDLRATDIYVRFLPADEDEYDMLVNNGLDLLDHPLDYKIIKEGDYYHDPGIDDDDITWQYAVVPADYKFPLNVKYEILDQCYISDHDIPTRADGIDWNAVERESYILTGNSDLLSPQTRASSDAKPSGRITLIDNSLSGGAEEGVRGVKLCVNSFVKFATAYTDDEGYYEIDKSFQSDVRYRLVFKNKLGFSLGFNLVLIPASMSALGKNKPEGIDVAIDSSYDRKLFSRAVVNNAVYQYYTRCGSDESSVSSPSEDLRIWLFQKLPSGSATMLKHGVLIDSDVISKYLGEYRDIVKMFLPDVTLGLKGADDYKSIYSAVCHEMAHCSHYMLAGKSFWNKYVTGLLKSFVSSVGFSYGSGKESYAGYCEVSEMWAFFMQNKLVRDRYGMETDDDGGSYWFSPQVLLYLDDRGLNENKIFKVLDADVNSRESLQEALSNRYPEHWTLIEQAFDRYRYE